MRSLLQLIVLTASAPFCFGQGVNQAAVDTLTKDVAIAVFGSIRQPKAQLIHAQLLACGDGCDAQLIIRGVGGWDAVGAKMEELSTLKNTAPFIAMSPGDANAAIRKQLALFYARYKNDNNYGRPLSAPVQVRILASIDAMLPPAVAPSPTAAVSPTTSDTITGDEASVNPVAVQIGQLERALKEKQENQLWMMILSAIVGLLVGAGAVYLLLYRAAQSEIKALLDENGRLSRSLDAARQSRPGNDTRQPANEARQPQTDYRQKASAYDAIQAELGAGVDPITAIRYLKQRVVGATPENTSPVRQGEPTVESSPIAEPAPVPRQPQPIPVQPPRLTPARSDVFYFPPPDPGGQFDSGQKSSTLSPESAYRFSVSADKPTVASFRFEADPGRVARFLTYRNYMIEPACESENSYSGSYTRIAMRRDGEAVLENGVWRVKTKALIRYE